MVSTCAIINKEQELFKTNFPLYEVHFKQKAQKYYSLHLRKTSLGLTKFTSGKFTEISPRSIRVSTPVEDGSCSLTVVDNCSSVAAVVSCALPVAAVCAFLAAAAAYAKMVASACASPAAAAVSCALSVAVAAGGRAV